jgi:hypothetical protein
MPLACGSNSSVQPVAASLASVAELLAVFGGAAGRSGNEPRAAHAASAHFLAADQERVDRTHNRRFADPPGSSNTLAEPDNAGKCIYDAEAIRGRARH